MNPFEFVKAINTTKQNLMSGSDNDELTEKAYVPFVINRSLSYFPDTILYSNEMNRHHTLDNKLQFTYLLNSIRSGKRFSKWIKKEDSDDLQVVKEYFSYSDQKAEQALSLLSPKQLQIMRDTLYRGGTDEKHYRLTG